MEKNTGNQKKKGKLAGMGRAFQLAEGERCFPELQRRWEPLLQGVGDHRVPLGQGHEL